MEWTDALESNSQLSIAISAHTSCRKKADAGCKGQRVDCEHLPQLAQEAPRGDTKGNECIASAWLDKILREKEGSAS